MVSRCRACGQERREMTIEELRIRHRELLERRKEELALKAEGRGDNLALFMVQEELLDVRAQIQALTPHQRIRGARTKSCLSVNKRIVSDKQQFLNWRREEQSLNDEIDEGHQAMLKAVSQSWAVLTPRQREVMKLAQSGVTQEQISVRLGINISTVNRTLSRAKRSMREETERLLQEQHLDAKHLDMADPNTVKVILSALTPKQAVYLYLYYSEWMSLREIAKLVGTDHSSIYRIIQRALRNIGSVIGYQDAVLENMDALDDLAYQLYSEIQDQDDIVPAEIRPQKPACGHRHNAGFTLRPPGFSSKQLRVSDLPPITVRTSTGQYEEVHMGLGHSRGERHRPHGKLLEALLARVKGQTSGTIMTWLTAVFCRVTGKHEKRGSRWWARIFSRRGSGN